MRCCGRYVENRTCSSVARAARLAVAMRALCPATRHHRQKCFRLHKFSTGSDLSEAKTQSSRAAAHSGKRNRDEGTNEATEAGATKMSGRKWEEANLIPERNPTLNRGSIWHCA